ncbi:hypothetical protein JCM33774_83810 [Actinophytocola sp. KF-1]
MVEVVVETAKDAAASAVLTASVEADRRHEELTPRLTYRLIVSGPEHGSADAVPGASARLTITLGGPH